MKCVNELCIMLLTLDAQPSLSRWILDLENNTIFLIFSDSLHLNPDNNEMPIDCTAILIGPVANNITMAVRLLPSVLGIQIDSIEAVCRLGTEFRVMLNANPDLGTAPNNTFLYYSPRATDESGSETESGLLVDSANMPFSETEGFQAIQVILDNNPPALAYSSIDLNEGILIFNFSQPVNISTWNFTDLYFQNSINNIIMLGSSIINDSTFGYQVDVNNFIKFWISIILSERDLNTLKSLLVYNVTFNHTGLLVEDFGGNPLATSSNAYRIDETIFDTTRPLLVSCYLDLLLNQLTLKITEAVDLTTFMFDGITIQNSSNVSIAVTYTLTDGVLLTTNDSTIVIKLTSSDTENIRRLRVITESSTYLSLTSSTFTDLSGNPIDSINSPRCNG